MSVPYSHDISKMADGGLQLNLPPDLVKPSQYPYLTNAVSRVEGQLQTREGIQEVCNVGGLATSIHTIFRLNQFIPGVTGERLFGIDNSLYTAPLPSGNSPTLLTGGFSFDGTPLSIVAFRFEGDPQIWAIIANAGGMMKRKDAYYQQLGLPAPTLPAIASAGGAGLLVGNYDWRYTYVNSVTLSESNPSPEQMTGGSTTTSIPSSFVNPSAFGDTAFINPADAYNGSTTGAIGTVSGVHDQASCRWISFAALPSTATSVQLTMNTSCSEGSARGVFFLDYTLDSGSTWNSIYFSNTDRAMAPSTITLPNGVDLTKLQVRARAFKEGGGAGAITMIVQGLVVNISLQGGGTSSLNLASQSAILCVTASIDPQEDHIRLYRRGGSLTDNWYFVSESVIADLVQGACGATYLEIDDNASDAEIAANPTLNLDNDMPVTSVQKTNQPLVAIWNYDERILGCGDPARPESVYFSKRGNADEYPPQNFVDVAEHGDEAMNGIVYSLRCFVFSRERMFMLLPNIIQGATFTPAETSCRRGLKGRWGLTAGERGIYFWSKDAIYRTEGGPQESIIDDSMRPLFPTLESPTGVSVNGYEAIDMTDENGLRMAYHNGEIWCDYTGLDSGERRRIIYDERRNRWRAGIYTPTMQMAYSEPGTDSSLLMGGTNGTVYQAGGSDDASAAIATNFRTGSFDQQVPLNLKEYANVAVDLDPGGATNGNPVIITPYINGNATPESSVNVTGTGRQRVPISLQDVYALNLSLDFTWNGSDEVNPILYQTDIEYRVEPAAMTHWQIPPTSLGMQGWAHIRDCYITLRSTSTVTLTLTFDVYPTQTFTISSTAGVKKKVYVPFGANKFKVVGISLDSDVEFRVYQEDSELRTKQWITKLGYQVIPLIGAEQVGK